MELSGTLNWIAVQTHGARPRSDPRVERILLVMRERYPDPHLSLLAIARSLGLNIAPQHLGRVFKHQTGMSFRQFLRKIRIEKAAELLANSSEEIKSIAGAVGYSDQSYFGRDFKALRNVTPTEFRANRTAS